MSNWRETLAKRNDALAERGTILRATAMRQPLVDDSLEWQRIHGLMESFDYIPILDETPLEEAKQIVGECWSILVGEPLTFDDLINRIWGQTS